MLKKSFICLAVFTILLQGATMQDIQDLPANTWFTVPNSGFKHLDPCPERTCSYSRVMGIWGIFAWSGGAFNTQRNMFIMWGGGHNDYGGNEIYAFEVNKLAWKLLTQPNTNPTRCADANSDGTPTSRHTYGAVDYLPDVDKFWNWGGAIDCGAGGCAGNTAWTFDFETLKWTGKKPSGTDPGSGCPGAMASYDPVTKRVWFARKGLFSYSTVTNTWTKHNSDNYYDIGSAMDTKRGLFILTGNGSVSVYNVRSGNLSKQTWSTTGNTGLVSKGKVGLDYDPVADRIVGWNGGSVYALNTDTKEWTAHSGSGAPSPNNTGTYGSWRYVPSVNAFIAVTGVDDNVAFFKLTAGPGTTSQNGPINMAGPVQLRAHPNPFKGAIAISCPALAGSAISKKTIPIKIYSMNGKMVKNLTADNRQLTTGITWNAHGLAPGIYMVQLSVGKNRYVQKLMLIK